MRQVFAVGFKILQQAEPDRWHRRRGGDALSVQELIDTVAVHLRPRHHQLCTRRGRANRFQVNFRNHRKIVVVDGQVGFTGGMNVGDEYLGSGPDVWRDAFVRVEGPAALQFQEVFDPASRRCAQPSR